MNDEMRHVFAIVAFHSLFQKAEDDVFKDEKQMRFMCEAAYDIADMMLGVANDTTRH
jgi:hypothetical protein